MSKQRSLLYFAIEYTIALLSGLYIYITYQGEVNLFLLVVFGKAVVFFQLIQSATVNSVRFIISPISNHIVSTLSFPYEIL